MAMTSSLDVFIKAIKYLFMKNQLSRKHGLFGYNPKHTDLEGSIAENRLNFLLYIHVKLLGEMIAFHSFQQNQTSLLKD